MGDHTLVRDFFGIDERLGCTTCCESVTRKTPTSTEAWVQEQKRFIRKHPDFNKCDTCNGTGRLYNVPPTPGHHITAAMGWNRCHKCFGEGAMGCQACGYFGVRWNKIKEPFFMSHGPVGTSKLLVCPRCNTVRMKIGE